jgi:hypothetical protein
MSEHLHPGTAADDPARLSRIESGSVSLSPSEAVKQINDALNAEGSPSGLLPAAENTLLAASDDFTESLGKEAIKIARARHATAVDRQDVLDADGRLRGGAFVEKQGWMLGIAGLTGGGAIATVVALLLSPKPVKRRLLVDYRRDPRPCCTHPFLHLLFTT